MRCLVVVVMLAAMCVDARAHAGEPLRPDDLWSTWSFEPPIVIPLGATALLFARGARRPRGTSSWQQISFWAGWAFVALSLISPLHPLGGVLFAAHMTQHEVLMLLAAPLLVMSRPLVPLLWSLPLGWRKDLGKWAKGPAVQGVWQWITMPSIAWCVHALALWVWHVPTLFEATLRSEWIHAAQHLSFLGSALLFWWSLFYGRGKTGYGAAFLYIFSTAVHTSILGALLTFSRQVWYSSYALTTASWGLTALEDQQLGGLIMWIPAGLIYLLAGMVVFALWMRESEVVAREKEYAHL